MRFLFSITFCFVLTQSSQAQGLWKYIVQSPEKAIKTYDTSYVKPLLNKLTLRYFFNVKQAELKVQPKDDPNVFRYKAGDFLRYGMGFGYRWLILNYSYGIDPLKKGANGDKTIRNQDLQMNIFGKSWLYDLRAQWYRGFTYKGVFRPDLDIKAFGGSFRHNFNHEKYSFKNTYDQTQWQQKSAGAALAGINLGYSKITADSSITFGNNTDFIFPDHENFNVALGGGYSYTFVYKKHFFATYTLTLFLDNHFIGSGKNFVFRDNLALNMLAESRFGLGYNSEKIYIGIQGTFHDLPGKLSNNVAYSYRYNNLKLLFVHRLNFNPFKKHE